MLKKIYTWIIVLFVPLTIYKINIMTFTLADAFLICVSPIYIINMLMVKRKININKKLFIISILIVFHLIVLIPLSRTGIQSDTLLRTFRYISYLMFIAIFAREYFDFQLGLKLLRFISFFSSIFLIIQFLLLNYGNYYLSGFIPGLPLSTESMNEMGRQYALGFVKRPTSIFYEPAHFSSYVLLYFGITLFGDNKKEKVKLILIGLALILSGSSTGILIAIGLVILWVGKLLGSLNNTKKVINFFMIILFFGLCFLIFTKTQIFNNFLDRTFQSKTATTGRFGNYVDVFSNIDLNLVEKLIGHGMVRYEEYIPSIPRVYYYFGTAGLVLFCFYSVQYVYIKKGYKRIALVLLLVSMLGTEIAFGSFMVMYLSFIVEIRETDLRKELSKMS